MFEHPFKQYALFKDFERKVVEQEIDDIPAAIIKNKHARAYFGILKLADSAGSSDRFAELRQFACNDLKGQERAVIEALCDAGGELPIADLAVKPGVGWEDAYKGFESVQRRLSPKIKKQRWKLTRQNNTATLKEFPE